MSAYFANNFKTTIKRTPFLIAVLSFLILAQPTSAGLSDGEGTMLKEETMRKMFDWIIELNVSELDRYMTHSGSKLHQMSKVNFTYRLFPRPGKPLRPLDAVAYKEMYFSADTAIGSRKLHGLDLPNGEKGLVKVVDNDYLDGHTLVATNAVVHSFLDVVLKNNIMQMVLCPKHAITQIEKNMHSFNFYLPTERTVGGGESKSISIFFRSDPKDQSLEKTYFYSKPFKRP